MFDDGDGELDEVEKMCAKYDSNKDGTFSVSEVKAIISDLQSQKDAAKSYKRLAFGLIFALIALCGVMVAIVILGNEVSKENHTRDDGLIVGTSGAPAQVAVAQSM